MFDGVRGWNTIRRRGSLRNKDRDRDRDGCRNRSGEGYFGVGKCEECFWVRLLVNFPAVSTKQCVDRAHLDSFRTESKLRQCRTCVPREKPQLPFSELR